MGSLYRSHRFPAEIISPAVWLYHRFTLSFRDVEDLLAERNPRQPDPIVGGFGIEKIPGLFSEEFRFYESADS